MRLSTIELGQVERPFVVPAPDPLRALSLAAGLERDVQRRVFEVAAGCAALMLAAYCAFYAVNGRTSLAGAFAAVFVWVSLLALWSRRSDSHPWPMRLLSVTVFLHFGGWAFYQGGINTPAVWWLASTPLLPLLAAMPRLGLSIATLFVGEVCALYWLESRAYTRPSEVVLSPHEQFLTGVLSATMLSLVLVHLVTGWRRNMSVALEQARRAAQEVSEEKARFLANMSHEIRTPLAGLIGSLELMRSSASAQAQQAQLLGLAETSAQTLLVLVNDILDWSKLESGQVQIEHHAFSVREIVTQSTELFAVQAFDKHLELTSSCEESVPAVLSGDSARVRQVLGNLISNAVKFTHRGGVHLQVSAAPSPYGVQEDDSSLCWVRFAVSDTGIGIAESSRASLFHAFKQGDVSITRRYGGTGLGLAICADLAALLGGRIDVSSVEGAGSAFTFLVPLRIEATAPNGAVALPANEALSRGVLVAVASTGMERQLRAQMAELGQLASFTNEVPRAERAAIDPGQVLVLDAALLVSGSRPEASLKQLVASGLRVVLLVPLGTDTVFGMAEGVSLVYKPVRTAHLRRALADSGRPFGVLGVLPERAGGVGRPPPPFEAEPPLVLLAEDNPVNQVIVLAMLDAWGVRYVVAQDGAEAVAMYVANRFDLVLMDMGMPVLDGLQASQRIREMERVSQSGRRVPIVAFSASSESEEGAACRAAGMDGFLSKPFGASQLLACVHRWCPGRATKAWAGQ